MSAPSPPELIQLVLHLTDATSTTREHALTELSKKREEFPDLAPLLWYSCGTIAALLQEIIGIYPSLSPPTLSPPASTRVCNALALLQCVASHPETRGLFLAGVWGGQSRRGRAARGPPNTPTSRPAPPQRTTRSTSTRSSTPSRAQSPSSTCASRRSA